MRPTNFSSFVQKNGQPEKYKEGYIFHAQNFPEKLFYLKTGYVKRYQASNPEEKVLELIYGPGQIISLSQLYKRIFDLDQNQTNLIYVYQAMTDVELYSIRQDVMVAELEKDPTMYQDFFYQSGINLRSNIFRLASNSLKSNRHKIAHQLLSLSYEHGGLLDGGIKKPIKLPMPQTARDIAEQLNIPEAEAKSVLDDLIENNVIKTVGRTITVLDVDLLKDTYLYKA